ncbi:hypothetical protein HGRIS_011986 [Hohenbuehelia grisea]|uniref:Uncharacterized protein n=1 Tax=Hohenbuehelia grisea TaxID=104357 RepID=A0ABR3JZ02_9AGAR
MPFRPGKGALARIESYYYPVRIIKRNKKHGETNQTWTVVVWRGCKLVEEAGKQISVAEENLVDELWDNQTRRRQIRLGQWIHAYEVPNEEDILLDNRHYPYTPR